MFTQQVAESLEKRIPLDVKGEDRRAAYSTIAGCRDGKSVKEICSYYSISEELVVKWINFLKIDTSVKQVGKKRGRKSSDLTNYVKSNIGKTVSAKTLAEELGISLPTFYNFYNANRGFFKKVKRGEFEIVNPDDIRKSGE